MASKNPTGNEFKPYSTNEESGRSSGPVTQFGIVEEVFFKNAFSIDGDEETLLVHAGCIRYKAFSSQYSGITLLTAFPFDTSIINLPVKGEIVEIFTTSARRYYRKLNLGTNINNNIEKGSGSSDGFKKDDVTFLEMFPGDTLIQSRFGQSIRFSAYNNDNNKSSPTIIIRNKISDKEKQKNIKENSIEDINQDGGTILISSNDYISKFLPGNINRNGVSDFKLKVWENNDKYALEGYPKKLNGNQIIITSDRLILSSRINEMMFFSKGMLSLVSDTGVTVDSNKGLKFVNHGGDIQFENLNRETIFFVGEKGKIFLGVQKDGKSFPAANGTELANIITELINEIIVLTVGGILTPSGPTTGMLPDNKNNLLKLAREFENRVLSKKVYFGM